MFILSLPQKMLQKRRPQVITVQESHNTNSQDSPEDFQNFQFLSMKCITSLLIKHGKHNGIKRKIKTSARTSVWIPVILKNIATCMTSDLFSPFWKYHQFAAWTGVSEFMRFCIFRTVKDLILSLMEQIEMFIYRGILSNQYSWEKRMIYSL